MSICTLLSCVSHAEQLEGKSLAVSCLRHTQLFESAGAQSGEFEQPRQHESVIFRQQKCELASMQLTCQPLQHVDVLAMLSRKPSYCTFTATVLTLRQNTRRYTCISMATPCTHKSATQSRSRVWLPTHAHLPVYSCMLLGSSLLFSARGWHGKFETPKPHKLINRQAQHANHHGAQPGVPKTIKLDQQVYVPQLSRTQIKAATAAHGNEGSQSKAAATAQGDDGTQQWG